MATAEQMRQLHPDPPTRHDHYQQAVHDALTWRIDVDEHWARARSGLTEPIRANSLLVSADGVIAALLRYGTPDDPS